MVPVLQATTWSFQQLKRPDILALVIVPCVIHSLLLFGGIYWIYTWLNGYLMSFEMPSVLGFSGDWVWLGTALEFLFDLVRWILLFGICLGLVGFGLTVTTTIAHFFASPFNGWLSAKAESQFRLVQHPEMTVLHAFKVGLSREWQRFRYWMVRAIPLGLLTLALFWIPVIGSLISLCWFIFGAWMVGLQAVDYAADNNGLSFQETLRLCQKSRVHIALLGALLMGMMLVPGLNLLSMALSVLSGTYLWVKHYDPSGSQARFDGNSSRSQ